MVNVERLRFADGEVLASTAAAPLTGAAVSRSVGNGQTVALSDLYSAGNTDGRAVQYYWITDLAGAGRVNLNGAVNLATAAQKAAGGIQVSAADFAELTYTGAGTETLGFQTFDGVAWSTTANAKLTNSTPTGVGAPRSLGVGKTVALSELYSAADAEGDTIQYYRITNPAGAGTLTLNGAVNQLAASYQAQGLYQFSTADFAKVTYTGAGGETLTFMAHDGLGWGTAVNVAVTNNAPVGTGAPKALARGETVALSELFSATDAEGDTIQYYRITNPAGAGTLTLNGAVNQLAASYQAQGMYQFSAADFAKVNLAGAADQARGVYQVSAADYYKLTYTGSTGENLTFQVGDGAAWSAETQVAVTKGTPAAVLPSTTLKVGETVALSDFVPADNTTYWRYLVYDQSGTGTFNLNGAVNLDGTHNMANIGGAIGQYYEFTPEDFAKVTYTGRGSGTLQIDEVRRIPHEVLSPDGIQLLRDATTVIFANRAPGCVCPKSTRHATAMMMSSGTIGSNVKAASTRSI